MEIEMVLMLTQEEVDRIKFDVIAEGNAKVSTTIIRLHEQLEGLEKEMRRLKEVNQVMLEALKLAENSLGSFVSDHGWSQSDMDNLDAVTAAITINKGEQQ